MLLQILLSSNDQDRESTSSVGRRAGVDMTKRNVSATTTGGGPTLEANNEKIAVKGLTLT